MFTPTNQIANKNVQTFLERFGCIEDYQHSLLVNQLKHMIRSWAGDNSINLNEISGKTAGIFELMMSYELKSNEEEAFFTALEKFQL